MRVILIFTVTVMASFVAAQQTQWLKAAKFRYAIGDTCRITLLEGERLLGTYLAVKPDSAGTIRVTIHDKTEDVTTKLIAKQRHHLAIPLTTEGTYAVTWDRYRKFTLRTPEELKNYQAENAIGRGTVSADNNVIVHEHVFDVLLIQSGGETSEIRLPGGFPLEIIPAKHPYGLTVGDPLTLVIKAYGKPVFGSEIVIRNRHNDRTTIQKIYPEKDGNIRMHISSPGPWMISYSLFTAYRNLGDIGITRVNLLFGY